jgi:radial spoke head protein 4A
LLLLLLLGVGIGQEESFRVMLALKKLVVEQPVTGVSFWGKIFGREKDYIIAQCTYREGEAPVPEEEPEVAPEEPVEEEEGDVKPKSAFVAPKPLPVEEYGTGVNKYAYFVCNRPGEPWVALPLATPAAIVASRKITKLLTGNLNTPVMSHPPFSKVGKDACEADLLRAIIARISAETHLSPLGLFTFDEDEEEDEDGGRSSYIKDEEFEGVAKSALLDSSMAGWAHHVQFILPQGRCKWVNPAPPKEDADEDEEEEEEEEEVEPETGPPLLTPAQEDEPVDEGPAWKTTLTSQLNGRFAAVVASSNKWPGAHAVAYSKGMKFENIYIGYGVAYSAEPYNPPLPPLPQQEYVVEEFTTEAADPTVEEEEQFKAEQAKGEDDGDDEDED